MLSFYNNAKHTIRSSSELKEISIKLGETIEHVITNSIPAPISAPITLAQMACKDGDRKGRFGFEYHANSYKINQDKIDLPH